MADNNERWRDPVGSRPCQDLQEGTCTFKSSPEIKKTTLTGKDSQRGVRLPKNITSMDWTLVIAAGATFRIKTEETTIVSSKGSSR